MDLANINLDNSLLHDGIKALYLKLNYPMFYICNYELFCFWWILEVCLAFVFYICMCATHVTFGNIQLSTVWHTLNYPKICMCMKPNAQ